MKRNAKENLILEDFPPYASAVEENVVAGNHDENVGGTLQESEP